MNRFKFFSITLFFFLTSMLVPIPQVNKENNDINIEKVNTKPGEVSVITYGAKPNDSKDDTAAIQAAIQAVSDEKGIVRFPAGTFLIDTHPNTGSLQMKHNLTIILDEKTILKSIPNNSPVYRMFTIYNDNNVTITGGTLIGDRYQHQGSTGEYGYGIYIGGNSNRITISNVKTKDFWGDGFIIEGDESANIYPTNIELTNCVATNNRRQGISITAGKNITVKNSTFSRSNGTAPEAGIDVERNYPFNLPLENVRLENNQLLNNNGYGLSFIYASNNLAKNNLIKGNQKGGVYLGGKVNEGETKNNSLLNNVISNNGNSSDASTGNGINVNFAPANQIIGNIIKENTRSGIHLVNHVGENIIQNNRINKNGRNGIYIWGGLYNQSGIVVQFNEINSNQATGLSLLSVTQAKVIENRIISNKGVGIYVENAKESIIERNYLKNNQSDEIIQYTLKQSKIKK
ncbi:right-handed parallel beta-helix repeat-containing protein [Bacillus sp. FJAT-52991]|uniref:Right-handed parallel beta-helix repeat-containing protein n=1 Tax=Bacillus kandeliae TaxID=3129297 RepID=A0ABZ2N6Z7_9BACI